MNVVCDHEEITEYRDKDGDLLACLCAHCGLPEGTPVVSSMHEGEVIEWWHNDEEIARREKADRIAIWPGRQRVGELREEGQRLAEMLALEYDVWGPSELTAELCRAIEENKEARWGWFRGTTPRTPTTGIR